jgi:hypothetical protein
MGEGIGCQGGAGFFREDQQSATPIHPTELRIIEARDSAPAMAARAITRAGTGHKYWSKFGIDTSERIRKLGKDLYSALYLPPIQAGPISTFDLPVAGEGYNVLAFVFDLVSQINGDAPIKRRVSKSNAGTSAVDEDGSLCPQLRDLHLTSQVMSHNL